MSKSQAYNAPGGQQPGDPNTPYAQPGQQFRPPVAPSPAGYTQSGSNYGSPQPQQAGTPQQGYSAFGAPGQEQVYLQQQPGMQQQFAQDGMTGLTSQMGQVGLEGTQSSAHRPRKKDRHAYHTLDAPQGGAGPLAGGQQGQFVNQNGQQAVAGAQFQQIAPGTNAPYQGQNAPASAEQAGQIGSAGVPMAGSAVTSAQGNVDPDQIPSVPRSRDQPAQWYLEHVYPTMDSHLPPPAAIPFVAYDQGNSAPHFARLSLNTIPATKERLDQTGLPLGMILQPLAKLQEGEQPVPLLDFQDAGPPRCSRCRAYINPFMTFRSGGNKFICNMCNFPNDVAPEYFSPTDPSGVRVDRLQRPELTLGTVEFTVPKEYWAKEPVGLRWLFLIDVTAEACNKGFMAGFCEGVMNALYGEASEDADGESNSPKQGSIPSGAKIGIITYDKEVQFYNLSPRLDKPQMMVMPDIEEPFVPLSDGLFVDPIESKPAIVSLLNQLPTMFADVKNPEPALLPALNAAAAALEKTGGKIACSLAALPTWGPGRLFMRDDAKLHGTDGEKKLLTTEHPGYRKLAAKVVESGIGCDFFLAAPNGGYLDIATIGHISATSGGECYYYPTFHNLRDTLRLSKEIRHSVTRETGYQALMKVRCSNGLQVSAYQGNFTHHTFGADLEFGSIDADKAISVIFSYDGKLDPKLDAHFQAALLYTTASGQRRVRCINLVASVSDSLGDIMRFVDQDAVVHLIAKDAATRVPDRSLKEVRATITEKTIDILAGYRKNSAGSNPPGQLVLPENLKELSMYSLGLIKSRALKGGREPMDRRVHDLRLIKSMGLTELSLYLYPRIISIHNLGEQDGFANENGHLRMPNGIRASYSKVEDGGVYIVDNGQMCLLWIHANVSPNLLEDLFGPGQKSLKELDPFSSQLPVLDTHLNAQVRNILQYLEQSRGSKALTVQLARQGLDGAEYEYARLLYEDRNNEAQSYVDWLVHLHRTIQLELSGQRKRDDTGDSGAMAATFAGLRTPYWG